MASDWIEDLPFLEACNARDEDTMKFVDEWLRDTAIEIFLEESEFAKELPRGPQIATLEPSQVTQRGFAQELDGQVADAGGGSYQITFSGKVNGADLTPDMLKQHVKKGMVLDAFDTDGEQRMIELTEAPGETLVVGCKAYGGTTIYPNSEAITWGLITTPWGDERNFEQPTGLPRDMEHTFTQIFTREIAIKETDKNLKDKVIGDPWAYKVKYNLQEMANEKARAMIRMRPKMNEAGTAYLSGYDVDDPGMAGIMHWYLYGRSKDNDPTIYVNLGGQPITDDHVRDAAHNLRMRRLAKFNKGRWQLWGYPTTMRYAERWEEDKVQTTPSKTNVGIFKKTITCEGTEVPFKADRYFPISIVVLLNIAQWKYGPFKGGQMRRKMIGTANWTDKMSVREQLWGLLPEDYFQMAVFYNVRPFAPSTN